MSDVASEARKQTSKKATRLGGGGLRIYKPGQGFYTRVGTAVGIGVLAVAGAFYLFSELERVVDPNTSYALPLRYGIAVGFLLVMGLVTYWIVGLGVRTNDFFIATEGEMKKVSWSTWPEVARSTKVVIVSVVLLGVFLFAVDLVFMAFFNWIGVLRGLSVSELVFGPGT